MLYALICRDKPGALQIRMNTREAHLAHIRQSSIVEMAGALVEEGEMRGSLVILNADSIDEAQAWADADPYKAAGLFESTTLTEWKKAFG